MRKITAICLAGALLCLAAWFSQPAEAVFQIQVPKIDIEKATNGFDADNPTGPSILVGDPVHWTYVVTNTGNVALSNVTVTDSKGVAVSCPGTTLGVGQSMTCTADGTAELGQYENVGTATGVGNGKTVSDTDPSHYIGYEENQEAPSIDIEKATNGEDADTPTGPVLQEGDLVNWTYVVTNTGNVALSSVKVTDDKLGDVSCPQDALEPGESMICTANGTAQVGQYANEGCVEGTSPSGQSVSDCDPSHYFGETPPVTGDQGCTPGYWKNHTDSWPPTGYSPNQSVQSVFSAASAYPGLGSATLLKALKFGGGRGVIGGAKILLRAAVAALLNASQPGVAYPNTPSEVVSAVNTALASGDRALMLALAGELDADNNLGCPLN